MRVSAQLWLIGIWVTLAYAHADDVPNLEREYADQLQLEAIFVNDIRLRGSTLLNRADVVQATSSFVDRKLTFEELRQARDALTALYIKQGYVGSGVVIADQEVSQGVVYMEAVEADLSSIRVRGNKALSTRYIKSRLRSDLGTHLSMVEVEHALRILQERPMLRRVNARLQPGEQRGHTVLDLEVVENPPLTLTVGYNNHRAPSVGEDQGVIALAHSSLTGRADYVLANYALTDGVDDYGIVYGAPLTAKDLTFEAYFSSGESDITESGFDQLDIVSEIETWGARLYRPLARGLNHELVVGLGFEHTETETSLLGIPFSFSPGEDFGESTVSLMRATVEWTWRRSEDAISVYGAVNYGVDWLDASDAEEVRELGGQRVSDLPDSRFTSFVAKVNYVRRLPWRGIRLQLSVTAQSADRPLLPSQQLAIGGAGTVRGYRHNQLVRDSGVIAQMELRVPLFADEQGRSRYGLTLAPFVDFGRGQNEAIGIAGFDRPQAQDISSVGAGLLWAGWGPLSVQIYYGEDLRDLDNRGDTLQEDGWHLQAALSWSFGGGG